jgi:hypothetical protein
MATVGSAEEKHTIATGFDYKMCRMNAECHHAEICASGPLFMFLFQVRHQLSLPRLLLEIHNLVVFT